MKPITVDELLKVVNDAGPCTSNTCKHCPLYPRCRDVNVCGPSIAVVVRLVKDGYLTLATDTNLPRSANWSVGEDINVPTTLPKWCKKGQWVLMNNNLYKIVEVNGGDDVPLTVKDVHGGYSFGHHRLMCPVRFRAYTYEEAKGLLGKRLNAFKADDSCSIPSYERTEIITFILEGHETVYINGNSFKFWQVRHATIDGVPIGIPEVDEEALKEG